MFDSLDSPSVTTPGAVTIRESESKTLTCTASGDPTPAYMDYKWIHPDGTITKSKQLEIRGATKDDTGRYRCQVSVRSEVYGLLNGTSDTMVTVQCKLTIQNCGSCKSVFTVLGLVFCNRLLNLGISKHQHLHLRTKNLI